MHQAFNQVVDVIRSRDGFMNTFAGLIAATFLTAPMFYEDVARNHQDDERYLPCCDR